MKDIEKQIDLRITAFVADVTTLVRQAVVNAVAIALDGKPRAVGARYKLRTTRIRRGPEKIAEVVETVLAHIKSNPNTRSKDIRNALKMTRPVIRDPLDRLMAAKKIKMKGEQREVTYA